MIPISGKNGLTSKVETLNQRYHGQSGNKPAQQKRRVKPFGGHLDTSDDEGSHHGDHAYPDLRLVLLAGLEHNHYIQMSKMQLRFRLSLSKPFFIMCLHT
ncbi:hypothetical protein DPEC_G00096290 [Dallia pectoralis]|uniref:Uncharacterized protein n=1 Tax=Dallia pectoralis TaxID=75939 RepID=A0ACC2GVR7_DALPE|nr:hypothetical protein DPEC_G00096290 [Dallia pectoralis]